MTKKLFLIAALPILFAACTNPWMENLVGHLIKEKYDGPAFYVKNSAEWINVINVEIPTLYDEEDARKFYIILTRDFTTSGFYAATFNDRMPPNFSALSGINVTIIGKADGNAYIDKFIDKEENLENNIFVPGNYFCIKGNKIMVAGDDPSCGVYFVPVEDPSKAVKVAKLAENSPSKLIGTSPNTGHLYNRIEIRTQYAGTKILLKTTRTITSEFIIETA